MPMVFVVLACLFTWLGFMSPVLATPWVYILIVLSVLALTLTPASIFLYFFVLDGTTRGASKVVMVVLEAAFYLSLLFVPVPLYMHFTPTYVGYLFWLYPPVFSLVCGKGLLRLESRLRTASGQV